MARKTTGVTTKSRAAKEAKAAPSPKPRASRREQKPVSRKPPVFWGTWFTVLLLAALIGAAYYLKQQKDISANEPTPTSGTTFVFTPQDGLPSSIEVKPAEGETVRLALNDKSVWALELPLEAEADQAQAQAAATQISALRLVSEVDVALDILGLEEPSFVITIGFKGDKQHILEVGDITPTHNGFYVRLDEKKTMIVALDGLSALLNLASFPPYLNTPTPSPLPPTGTPTPRISETATSTP
jgi:hypothetical protein